MASKKYNPSPAGYSVQFGYGTQPASKGQEYVDKAGNQLEHTFAEIDGLFGSAGDEAIGLNRTGIASGTNLSESIDSIVNSITDNSGNNADLEYWFRRNTKSIVGMESNENWTAGAGTTVTEDTSNWRIGYQGLRLTEPDNVASTQFATLSFNSKNMEQFNDTSESATNDYIRFSFYVSDTDAINTGGTGVSVILSSDPTVTTDRWRLNITTQLPASYTGWVFVDAPKSSFSNDGGSPDWGDIQGARVAWASNANYSGDYVVFDDIWLCRKDPIESAANPFQKEINGVWTRDYTIKDGIWYVGDGVVQGFLYIQEIQRINSGYDDVPAGLQGNTTYTDFLAEALVICGTGTGGYTNMLTWEVSDTQRVKAYVYQNNLYIYSHFDTVEVTDTVPFNINVGDVAILSLEKRGSTVTAKIKQSNDYDLAAVTLEVNTDKAGTLSVSNNATWTPMISLSITTTKYASVAGKAHTIGRYPWFSVVARDNYSLDYYIDPVSGSDSYDGTSAGKAFKTIQRLLLEPFAYTYVRNGTINIHLASGDYDEQITMPSLIGSGTMNWLGSAADATACMLQKISANACQLYVTFNNITLTASATSIYINKCNSIYLYNVQATANGGGADYGVQASYSNVYALSCIFSNKNAAFKGTNPGTHIMVNECSGTANTYSLYVEHGAMGHNIGTMPGSTTSSFAASGSQIIL
jgi:hypothetical protein